MTEQNEDMMKTSSPPVMLMATIVFYVVGLFLIYEPNIEPLKHRGIIRQEQIIYTDADGEEHEDETLIEIAGLGPVLSYRDIYSAAVPFLIVACILGKVLFNSTNELRFMIFTNSILGLLLLWLTTKPNIISTILYWCGIITAYIYVEKTNKD